MAVVVVAACNGGGGPGGGISPCSDYFDACVTLQNECVGVEIFDARQRSAWVQYCNAIIAAPGAAGLSSGLATCTAAVQAAQCGGADVVSTCYARGTLPDGAACASDAQCAGGLCTNLKQSNPASELECGVCATYVGVGSPCGLGVGQCDPSTSVCMSGSTDGSTTPTCVALLGAGAACNGVVGSCQPTLSCDTSTQVCVAPPTQGQPCTPNVTNCEIPLRCANGTCAPGLQQGAACIGYECAPGLNCTGTTPTCEQPAIVQAPSVLGTPCTVGAHTCGKFALCINGQCAEPDLSACH